MNVETIDSWRNIVHLIGHSAPEGLTLSNIAGIQVLLDLILTGAKLHGSAIVALVDVLVDVLDGFDGCNPLNVNVATIFPDEVRTVRHHPAIVDLLSIYLKRSPCITTTKNSIRILRKRSLISEWLWKVLGALLGFGIHTGSSWIMDAAGIVDHELLDQLEKLWLRVWIRKLCRKKTVYVLRSAKLACRIKVANRVGMRKPPLLKLIRVAEAHTLSKTVIDHDVPHKLLSLCMENPANNIRTIFWPLAWEQSSLNLWPMRICSHGKEKVCATVEVTVDSESILTGGLHVSCAASERRGEDDPGADLSEVQLWILLNRRPEI
jgi:hypothetical protein